MQVKRISALIVSLSTVMLVGVACGTTPANTGARQPTTAPSTVTIKAVPTDAMAGMSGMGQSTPMTNATAMPGGSNMGDMSGMAAMPTYDAKDPAKAEQTFLSDMIAHHQGAIDMSQLAATQAKHDEIKQLAKNIITAQQKEIGDQTTWLKTWYTMAPMQSIMSQQMTDDVQQLKGLSGDDFDKKYMQLMIPHHQSAIDMAKQIQPIATHAEIKKLTNDIITSQTSEITQMQSWLKTWYAA